MNRPRPNLAPTSPPPRGDLHTGDLAPRPHPVGGEVSTGSPTATTTNTPPPRPRGDVNDTCADMLDFDQWWFVCCLPTGHDGPHQDTSEGTPGALDWYDIRWAQRPAVVVGQVMESGR